MMLLITDIEINVALGLYFLDHTDTVLGSLMMRCPVAISPVIMLIEGVYCG
jgi:hypothetical protein